MRKTKSKEQTNISTQNEFKQSPAYDKRQNNMNYNCHPKNDTSMFFDNFFHVILNQNGFDDTNITKIIYNAMVDTVKFKIEI